ncbi:MAG: amidohydrolase family protein [Gammaproteobacteria bacterium]
MRYKAGVVTLSILFLALISVTMPLAAANYDLVILNGRVMDPESGLDAVRNVGVKDGKIAKVTKRKIKGKETIDASGHVVAPGFIDGHVHTVDIPLGQKAALRDGVTTTLDLEVGALPVDRWYSVLEGKSQTNYGATVSMTSARTATFDPEYLEKTKSAALVFDIYTGVKVVGDTFSRVPTDDEIANILKLVDEGLKQGALGVGPPVGYLVDGTTSQEMIGVQKLAGKYGRFSHVHTRFSSQEPPTSALMGFQEVIASAGQFGGGVIIAHFTAQSLALTEAALDYVDELRAAGIPVVLEIYPYNFGSAGNGIGADYLKPDNYQKNMGRTYEDIIDTATGERLTKKKYEALVKSNPFYPVMFYNAKEEDMEKALAHPDVLIGCDCFPFADKDGKFVSDWDTPWDQANTHPRTTGAHGKVLRLTREKKLMPLMTAISKMSYQYAKFLEDNGVPQMANKGRIKVGADADITIFDPDTVRDNSSLDKGKNALPTTGIPYVVVNGSIVVKDSKVLKGVYAGQPIRAAISN